MKLRPRRSSGIIIAPSPGIASGNKEVQGFSVGGVSVQHCQIYGAKIKSSKRGCRRGPRAREREKREEREQG